MRKAGWVSLASPRCRGYLQPSDWSPVSPTGTELFTLRGETQIEGSKQHLSSNQKSQPGSTTLTFAKSLNSRFYLPTWPQRTHLLLPNSAGLLDSGLCLPTWFCRAHSLLPILIPGLNPSSTWCHKICPHQHGLSCPVVTGVAFQERSSTSGK